MKVLWLCNIVLPRAAEKLNMKASNKEGWLSGICENVSKNHDFELAVCFPVSKENDGVRFAEEGIEYYGFYEDTVHPEKYDKSLEGRLSSIVEESRPDVVHIFGTEFPHTLAMCKIMEKEPQKVLVGIQGILDVYKDHYFDGLPKRVINRVTLRDFLKQDSLKQQHVKYCKRALNEVAAVKLAGNLTGRTPFDKAFSERTNPKAKYHFMNETLRSEFFSGEWDSDKCEEYSIFLSQGNYPIKGMHVMLEALPMVISKYPKAKVYVAGDVITRFGTVKEKIKIGSYGLYLRELVKKYNLEEYVEYIGNRCAKDIKERLLKSNVFVCPSSIENSPNSLGEAMLLGVPSIASRVGGTEGIFTDKQDGLMFENTDSKMLAEQIVTLFSDKALQEKFSKNAREHALRTHDGKTNYKRLLEIYEDICR